MHGRDGAALAEAMRGFDASKNLAIPAAMRARVAGLFTSARIDADRMNAAMRWAADRADEVIDPHSAIGLAAAQDAALPADVPVVTLATAHPAKFPDAVEAATGRRPSLPPRLADLFGKEERYVTLPATFGDVTRYIAQRATPKP